MNRLLIATSTAAALVFSAGTLAAQAPDGAQVYARNCVACHGAAGVPNPAMVRSLGAIPNFSLMSTIADSTLLNAVTNGRGRMPAYKTRLTAAEIRAALAHVRTLRRP